MLKELLCLSLIPSLISSGSQFSPYLVVNQMVIYNNIESINLRFDNPDNVRGNYEFVADIEQSEENLPLVHDSNGLCFEYNGQSYYLKSKLTGNIINGDVNQITQWSLFFNQSALGLNFENLRNDYLNKLVKTIDWSDFNEWLVDDLDAAFFYSNYTNLYVQTYDYVDNDYFNNLYADIFLDSYTYYFDVSFNLSNYTYNIWSDYNFEFVGTANGSISDGGPIVSLSGDYNYSYSPTTTKLSSGYLVLNFTNHTNLDYFTQHVHDDYPYYLYLQSYINDSVDINAIIQENINLKSQNQALIQQVDNLTSGNTMQNLLWTVAGTPWESFKNIWNVDVLGVNISGFITGLITALAVIWCVKKLFK